MLASGGGPRLGPKYPPMPARPVRAGRLQRHRLPVLRARNGPPGSLRPGLLAPCPGVAVWGGGGRGERHPAAPATEGDPPIIDLHTTLVSPHSERE